MERTQFNYPTTILFGPGVRDRLAPEAKARGLTRVLLVADRSVAKLPFLPEILKALSGAGIKADVFSEFEGNPLESHVVAGVKAYRDAGAEGLIAIGGGAVMDVAKAIAVLVFHPGKLFDYEDKPGAKPIDAAIPPILALPTTAGTGSEVGRSTVISDDKTHAKKIVFSPKLMPAVVLADPELTLGLPPKVTAATGMDALTHCVESYLAKGYHPMADGIALEGVRLIAKNLARAVEKGSDLEARGHMLMASMMGAVAFQKGLGITHSCAHALSTVHDLHHGLANGVMIPYCMEFNLANNREKFLALSQAVGRTGERGFLDWLRELRRQIGIPDKLSELGVRAAEPLIEVAWNDPCHQCNPRSPTREDFLRLYKEAI
jgi:alcohol dehydrogenase class IV